MPSLPSRDMNKVTRENKGLPMIIYPSAFNHPRHSISPFRTAQLSVHKVRDQSRLAGDQMSDQQPVCSEFSPLTAVVHSYFQPDGINVSLTSKCSPSGWIALTRLI